MLNIPVLRWGQPYTSIDVDEVAHFVDRRADRTREPRQWRVDSARHAEGASRPGGAARDPDRRADRARRHAPASCTPTPRCPWATGRRRPTNSCAPSRGRPGMPERLCRANMKKNTFVLGEMGRILTSLTRGSRPGRAVARVRAKSAACRSAFRRESPVLGLVLPSNSPGVHTLWLPVIPLQIGLVLKPGPQEPWTPYRMAEAFFQAGIPREAISIYPGAGDVGAAVLDSLRPKPDLRRHADRRPLSRQPQGPGPRSRASRRSCSATISVDDWERYLDVMVDSVFANSGRGCINCSGIWVSRHGARSPTPSRSGWRRAGAAAGGSGGEPRRVHGARASPTPSRSRSTRTCRRPG